jgi:hypothetical protein
MASTKPIVVDGGAPTDATRQAPGVPVHVGTHRDPCVEEAMDDGPKVCRAPSVSTRGSGRPIVT